MRLHSSLAMRAVAVAATVCTGSALGAAAAFADPGVTPAVVTASLDPGASMTVTKTVHTPEIPPRPDVVLVVDRTGSMEPYIANVKAQMSGVISAVRAVQPDAQFAVTSYCDEGEPNVFTLESGLTADDTATTAAVNGIALCDGGDTPESQLNALWQVGSGGNAIDYRSDSSRIVAWFGDQPGHDPSLGHTQADAIGSLTGASVKVVAVSVGANQLDATGQATAITTATGGTLLTGVPASDVADKIVEGLKSLPVTVTASSACDPGLSVSLAPASRTVTSGEDAVFTETITAAASAPEGAALGCTTTFSLNGMPGGPSFVQTVSIHVNDVTAPTVTCPVGPNPSGKPPTSDNPDGFFRMVATDNVDASVSITVKDTASPASFGPYASGTTFKLTQDPTATPSVRKGQGAVQWKFILKGDALLSATDAAGNTGTALCEVPPHS